MKKGIYAFSGDPITYGHVHVIEKAAPHYERLYVAIGENPEKEYLFTIEERVDMARRVLAHLPNVEVCSFRGLLVDFAYEHCIDEIVRGLRDNTDMQYEVRIKSINDSQRLGVATVFFPCDDNKAHISSSAVKALQREQGLIHEYVPLYVKQRLEEKISGQFIVGLTGGIATGKSRFAALLADRANAQGIEFHHLDLDRMVHYILGPSPEPRYRLCREQLVTRFGPEIALPDGGISRKRLGQIVFGDPAEMKKLDEVIYEPIMLKLRRELYGLHGLILLEAALLADKDYLYLCNNNIIVVTARPDVQTARLVARDGSDPRGPLTQEQAMRRVRSQWSNEEKLTNIRARQQRDHQGFLIHVENNSDSPLDAEAERAMNEILAAFPALRSAAERPESGTGVMV
jgi:pantetheine-phosphate adenylyltransferase